MRRVYWIHMDPPQNCRRSRKDHQALAHSQPTEERIIDMHDENASEGSNPVQLFSTETKRDTPTIMSLDKYL